MPNWGWAEVTIDKVDKGSWDRFVDKYLVKDEEGKYHSSSVLMGENYNVEKFQKLPSIDLTNNKWEDSMIGKKLFKVSTRDKLTGMVLSRGDMIFGIDEEESDKYESLAEMFGPDWEHITIESVEDFTQAMLVICAFIDWKGGILPMDWYGFNIATLGTKWNFELRDTEIDEDGKVTFSTETAWDAPKKFFEFMSAKLGHEIHTVETFESECKIVDEATREEIPYDEAHNKSGELKDGYIWVDTEFTEVYGQEKEVE